MAIKVFIKRHVKADHLQAAIGMLQEFRRMAIKQPGYISGETLTNHYDPPSITVISSWRTVEDWIRWQSSDKRAENEAKLEKILEVPTKYEIYDVRSSSSKDTDPAFLHTDEVS
jgi:heme-degrading monooxygenase HmoA